jgi:hypothetical protein
MKTHTLLSAVALALVVGPVCLFAADSIRTQPSYTVHEWGTFTSIQGSDGKPIPWNPFVNVDLPAFVYNRAEPLRGDEHAEAKAALARQAAFSKGSRRWLQRMETPVIYFHADAPLTVSAEVRFPAGVISEWYPQVTTFGPSPVLRGLQPATSLSFIRWSDVRVQGPTRSDAEPEMGFAGAMATGSDPASHYFHARHAAANAIVAQSPLMTASERVKGQPEKFLFYRGAGDFATPLKASFQDEEHLVLENVGSDPLLGLQVFEGRRLAGKLKTVDLLEPGARIVVRLDQPKPFLSRPDLAVELRHRLKMSLVGAGLFEDEAEAMLATWDKDWLDDDGLRVLYVLPRSWTDATLPLELTPKPASLVRVMLGRVELLRPSTESLLCREFIRFRAGEQRSALAVIGELVNRRFAEPALTRVDTLERGALLERLGLTLDEAGKNAEFLSAESERQKTLQMISQSLAGVEEDAPGRAVAATR